MTVELSRTHQGLRAWGRSLETRVAERTAELQSLCEQMATREKLASIGELSAGIAHEINNPNTFIRANLAIVLAARPAAKTGRVPRHHSRRPSWAPSSASQPGCLQAAVSANMAVCMKTTVEISEPLFTEAKRLAAREKTTVRALVEEGLRRTIEAHKERRAFKLRQVIFGGSGKQATPRSWEEIRELIYEGRGS